MSLFELCPSLAGLVNNLNPLEKMREELIKSHMEDYMNQMNIIPKEHHRARHGHNTLTAKLSIDENINSIRSQQKNVVYLLTDLTAAYDTVDHRLLITKLEQIGFRSTALKLLTNYLLNRKIYVKVHGTTSKLLNMPNKSVVKGSKMADMFFTTNTLEVTFIPNMMKT